MEKNVTALLKRFLKKKKRVSETLIICFLITGSLGYAEPLEISDSNVIETIGSDEHYDGVIMSGDGITLNVKGSAAASSDNSAGADVLREGNGILVARDIKVSINNSGIISGKVPTGTTLTKTEYSGNGIFTFNESDSSADISNNGFLIGNVEFAGENFLTLKYSGNGILGAANPAITIRKNGGALLGKVTVYAKEFNSIYNNFGYSGNGIYSNGGGDIDIEENSGLISGRLQLVGGNYTGMISAKYSGNGVYDYGWGDITIEENSGVISGDVWLSGTVSSRSGEYSGVGIYNRNGSIVVNDNSGIISGNLLVNLDNSDPGGENIRPVVSGMGIFGYHGVNVTNSGLIRGSANFYDMDNNVFATTDIDSGNGISVSYDFRGRDVKIENSGAIIGSQYAIKANAANAASTINNYGVMVGGPGVKKIGRAEYNNLGIEVELNNDGTGTVLMVTNGNGGADDAGNTIINADLQSADTDSYLILNLNKEYIKNIINGTGSEKGTLAVNDSDLIINDSTINSYKTSVSLEKGGSLAAADTVFNGGGLEGNDAVIKGVSGGNSVALTGLSIINGKIDLGDGNDTITIENTVQINGDIYGGTGSGDTLDLVEPLAPTTRHLAPTTGLAIFHTIAGFEEIYLKGDTTLYETAKIEDSPNIHIESHSSLNLRIDPIKTDEGGRVIGHAFYGSNAVITTAATPDDTTTPRWEYNTDGGIFNIITNGLGVGGVIAMSDDSGNQVTFEDNPYIRTDSIITMAEIDENADIKISVGEDLDKIFSPLIPIDPADPVEPLDPIDPVDPIGPDRPDFVSDGHYEKLDLIYKSIISSGDNINALYPTVNTNDKTMDLAGENLLLLLNDIFMANPYGYTARTSKDSMGLFNEMVLNNPFRANEGNWMVYGGLTFGGDDYDSNYKNYIKGDYYGFDTYGVEVNADSSTYGGYALAEYGVGKNTSAGFFLGGANSNTDISNGSKIDGDSIYVGAYAKSEINNFKLTAGLGYQYSNYDTTRVARNKYQYNKYEEDITTDGFSAYTGLSYDYALNSKWSLEPKFNLVYSRVTQDSISEEGILSIETDKESFNYIDTEIGMDLVRKISLDSGEGKFRLGLSYVYALEGSDADYVTGRYQGGSDFDILVPERDKGTSKIKASYDVEDKSGIVYSVGGAYLPNENRDEYYASVGIGFKFNNLKDFIPTKTSNIPNVKKEVKTLTLEEAADVKIEEQKTNAVITDNISGFNLNSSKLTREMEKELDKAALEIQRKKSGEIKVIGHTDNTGPKAFNKKLSLKRAESAKSQLSKTLPEVEISTMGEGGNQPLESNDTLDGRKINRRIEIKY